LASRDIDEAYDYVAEHDPLAADRQTDRFHQLFAKLAEMPGIGTHRDELQTGMRCLGIGKYLVYYKVMADELLIVRVIHSARDQSAQFDR